MFMLDSNEFDKLKHELVIYYAMFNRFIGRESTLLQRERLLELLSKSTESELRFRKEVLIQSIHNIYLNECF